MAKRPDLRHALKPRNETAAAQPAPQQDDASPAAPKDPHFRPGREGKSNVTGYFHPAVKKQLRILACRPRYDDSSLLAEALNDLFAKHGKPEISRRTGRAAD